MMEERNFADAGKGNSYGTYSSDSPSAKRPSRAALNASKAAAQRRPTPIFSGENTPLLLGPVTFELGEEEVKVFRRKSYVPEAQLAKAEEQDSRHGKLFSLCFFFMGWGTFACCEALLLQTSLFDHCLKWGDGFYAYAAGALFVPGLLVQGIQGAVDLKVDKALGTLNANTVRVLYGHITQLFTLLFFLLGLFWFPSLQGSTPFLLSILMFLGTSLAVLYGGYSQVVAIFPRRYYSFFFMGTMTCFLGLAPLNTMTRDLCELSSPALSMSRPALLLPIFAVVEKGQNVLGEEQFVTHWNRIFIYYGCAVCMNLFGMVNFLGLTRVSPSAKTYFEKKDLELKEQLAAVSPRKRMSVNGLVLPATSVTYLDLLKQCWVQAVVQFVSVTNSLIVAAEYTPLRPVRADVFGTELTTIMLYNYYMMMFVGISLTLSSYVRSMISENIQLLVAIARTFGVVHIILYVRGDIGPRNDYAIILIYSLYMMTGGFLFSVSFSDATSKFTDSPTRSKVANLMNMVYYAAICVSVIVALYLRH